MENKKGTLEFFGIKPTLELLENMSLAVEKWIEREQCLMFLPKTSNYFVHIERLSFSKNFLCYIQVKIGSRKWQYQTCEAIVSEAMKKTLKGLNAFHVQDPLPPEQLFEHRAHLVEYPQYCDPENNAFLHAKYTFSAA